ncbi:MAG: hypothetical protein ACKVQB_05845 [Bacteroidia bacterium]
MQKVILLFGVILLFSTCRKPLKDVKDYYPVVETVSATVQDDGTVLIEGQIVKDGETEADLFGFCMSKEPIPNMVDNQISNPKVEGKKFSGVYEDFELNTPYYFRTWASNDFGYSYGNIIYLDSIKPAYKTAPCTPSINTFDNGMGAGYKSISNVYVYTNQVWEMQWVSSGSYFYLTFSEIPKTGIYKITDNWQPDNKSVNLKVSYNATAGKGEVGQKVYVNRMPNGEFEVTICSVPVSYNGIIKNFTTKFMCPDK